MSVALEPRLGHPKHNICLNNISKPLARARLRAYNTFNTSLSPSLFDSILEITVDEEDSVTELACFPRRKRRRSTLAELVSSNVSKISRDGER